MKARLTRMSCFTAAVLVIPLAALGQSGSPEAVQRTAWGAPDLGGVWDYNSLIPLERPAEYEGREFMTEEEAASLGQQAQATAGQDQRHPDASIDIESAYNAFWSDAITTVPADRAHVADRRSARTAGSRR